MQNVKVSEYLNYLYSIQMTIFALTLKAPRKNASAEVVYCKKLPNITDELSIEANSVDPEQTAPIGAVWSGSTLFAIEATLTFQQRRKADDFCCDWRIKG